MKTYSKRFVDVVPIKVDVFRSYVNNTTHALERKKRIEEATDLGDMNYHSSYLVNLGHTSGMEVHTVYTNGVIAIMNATSFKLITVLIARPGQLRRYGITDEALLRLARKHQEEDRNNH